MVSCPSSALSSILISRQSSLHYQQLKMARGLDKKQNKLVFNQATQPYEYSYDGREPDLGYNEHSASASYNPDGQYYAAQGAYPWQDQASPTDEDDDGNAASMYAPYEGNCHTRGIAFNVSQHGASATVPRHGRPAKRGTSSQHGSQAAVYNPQYEPEDPSYEDTCYGYRAATESEQEIQQLYRKMGDVNLDDRVLAVPIGGNLNLDLGDQDGADEVPHNFDASLYDEHFARHDKPLPELPRQRHERTFGRRDARKEGDVEVCVLCHDANLPSIITSFADSC